MIPAGSQKKRGSKLPLKGKRAGKNEEEESNDLRTHRESRASESVSVKDAPAASPVRFYARLRRDLEDRGIDIDTLPRLTPEGGRPPCFETKAAYEAWLACASLLGATVPYRFDMPAEPNYCYDCHAKFKRACVAAGICNFPKVRFETRQTVVQDDEGKGIEIEQVGVSRSKMVAIDIQAEYDPEQEG